jgi:pyruvate-formate lyase-activating enzyme
MLKTFYLSLKYCDKIDFLPFHNLAKAKYENLKMKYKLANFEETSNIELESFIKKFNKK